MSSSLADLIATRFATPAEAANDRPANATEELLLGHRSRRKFQDRPISDDELAQLFACAMSAPQKSDLQQVAIIHLKSRERFDAVADLIPSMPWIKTAPVFLLFCGDGRRIGRVCEMRGTPYAHRPIDAFLNAAVDTALVMQNFIVAAEARGLGCCPISAVREIADTVVRVAELPDRVFPVSGLCVGYPADDPAVSVRLPMSLTVHIDRYDDSRLPQLLDDYDRRRAERNPIPPHRQRKSDLVGHRDFYGWSDDKARQTSSGERTAFCDLIRRTFAPLD